MFWCGVLGVMFSGRFFGFVYVVILLCFCVGLYGCVGLVSVGSGGF
jgi:hypothetical protein